MPLKPGEQLNPRVFPRNWGIEHNKSELFWFCSGGWPHYKSRSISLLAVVFHFSSEVILIKLICMSIYWWSIKEPKVSPMLLGACSWQGLIMEEEISWRAKLISQHNSWIKQGLADGRFSCQSMSWEPKLRLQAIIIFGCKRSHE